MSRLFSLATIFGCVATLTDAWTNAATPVSTIARSLMTATLESLRSSENNQVEDNEQEADEFTIRDSFNLLVLGDLHMEDDMTNHLQARDDCLYHLDGLSLLPTVSSLRKELNSSTFVASKAKISYEGASTKTIEMIRHIQENTRVNDLTVSQLELLLAYKIHGNTLGKSYLVSLGDLGRKDIRHEPGDAGTTQSFLDARTFLQSFALPYDLVSGNHDLEGLDEFSTDFDNLNAWMDAFNKPSPQFCRRIGERTLLVGLSTVRFRSSPFSSHEVHVDDAQIKWFINTVHSHPAKEGWKILVFSHAPIMGSGLRVLQNVHVVNGCAWLNHCSDENTRSLFIRTVRDNSQIKAWFSGHFHLSHDYEDALSVVNNCVFVQVGVIGPKSSRDGCRQTRLVRGNDKIIQIFTINHHQRDEDDQAVIRLDAQIDLDTEKVLLSYHVTRLHPNIHKDNGETDADWFQAYSPAAVDGCYIEAPDGSIADAESIKSKVCWWHMVDGKVIGLHQGQVVEYDAETLSPLGIVVNQKELDGREVVVVANGTALVLVDKGSKGFEIIHPNEDGSYWRKYQRNKAIRQTEKAREAIARLWLEGKQEL